MKLRTRIEELRLRHTFTIARSSEDVARVVITEVSRDGLTGYGEASPSEYYGEDVYSVTEALSEVEGLLARSDPTCYHHLLADAESVLGARRAALCALDTAVHDWVGKSVGVPFHKILGLDAARTPVSSFTIGIDAIDNMVEKLEEARDYPIYKVKLGTDHDLDIVRALRERTDSVIRVDANCAWTASEAIEKSRELERLGVEFIEQPLPPANDEAMEEVFAKSALPLLADESAVTPSDVPRLEGRFHGINIKLVKCGGIRPALRMVHVARALGMKVMLGCMIESSACITAAAEIGSLADYLDLDGNVLITNDPFRGVENHAGRLILPKAGVGPVRTAPL